MRNKFCISNLPASIKEAIGFVRKHSATEASRLLKAKGWKRHRPKDCSGAYFFSSPCEKFFLKETFHTGRKPRISIPTIVICNSEEGCRSYKWVLQPKADVSNQAQEKAYEYFENNCIWMEDPSLANLGIYNGRAVQIDW